ncbi:MAG: Calx-beta domain-containing protein [Thiocapsa sp. C3-sup]|uniref:Calx-beta domain-containing protein n=1 Tax=Thiocapsa sp. C3-sup TaxID=3137396 RepID=UPI0035B3523E
MYDEQLFENVGGAFVDRTAWSGINGIGVGDGRHGTWLDINDDGLLDLISVNFSDNLFWERQASGSTGFVRANAAYGVDYVCLFGNHAVQLLDATGDGRFEVLCVNDATFPSALLDTATVPFTNLKAMLPPQPLVNDVALGDFNGNLRTDILVLRGGLRPNEALQVGPNAIEAYNQVGENSGSKGFRFRTDGVVTFDVATIQFWEGYVFIGANGWNPPNVKDLSFVLDAADPQTWGIQQHDPSLTTRGIYVGFDPASQTWDVQVHSDDGGRRSYFLVTSTQPISQVESTGLNGHDLPWTPQLFRNTESGFEEGTFASGLGVPLSCASVVTGDFDNDGDLDLYFVCRGGAQNLPNRLFENQGDGTFAEVDVTGAVGAVGFNVADGAGTGDSVAVADVDLDGYLDLFVTNGLNMDPLDYGGPNQLFRNLGGSNKWIMLDLVGVQSNRDAVGAKVFATAGGKAQLREQAGGTHRWSQNHQRIHFGVAQSSTVDLRIEWPSGQIDEYSGLSVNELYRVTEGLAIDVVDRVPPPDRPGPQPGDECGAPIYDLYRDPGVFVWKECDTGHWRVRVSGGGIPETVQYNGYISATRSFPSLTPVGLEGLDQVVATNTNRIDYRLYVASAGDDGFDFDLPPDGRACFSLDEPPRGSIYVGARRQQVSSPFDLETLGPCPILSALSADDVAVNEADGTAEFVVTLSSPSAAPVTVSYATADGTATAGEDYESTSGVLTFAPGETVQVVEVAVLDDTAPEATESFDLVLSEASGATIARGRAVGTILDDDTPLSCGQPSYAAGSEAGVFLWQDCANARWHARVTAGGSGAAITYRGEIVASEPFTQAQGVLLELPWDVVDVTDPTRLGFTLGVRGTGQDGLAFAFPADADVCFGLDAPAGAQVYVGVGKTAVATPFDLTTLGACVPPPVISISDTALSEADGPASVVVTLSVPRSVPVTVSYATVDGTATAGEDYESTSGVLTFVPGETVQVVEVAVIDDNAPEPTETFGVLLSNAVGAALGQATATVSILDDDVPLPELSVGDVTASEGDGVLGFVVSLSAASAVPVTVGYATVDGTALAGSDYLPVGESEGLTFQPGETTKTVNVELIDDDIPEPTKTLYLELIAPDVVVLTRAQGTATILDDDGALLELSVSDVTVGEDAGVAGFAVSLSGASAAPVTVSYATADGTATAGEDYESTSGVLTFAPGETVQVVEVAVFDDTAPDATESFDLVLSEASGATIARGRAVGTILDDDTPLSCGQPSYAAGSEAGVFLWQDCANARWHAWVTAGGSGAVITYTGEIVASEPFTQAQGELLELPWDVVDVTDPTRIGFTLGVRGTGQDGLAFAFPADADVCFGLDAPAGAQVYVGVGKTAVATPFDLNTLGSCVALP